MSKNSRYQRRVFNAGDHPQLAATFGAVLNIDRKNPSSGKKKPRQSGVPDKWGQSKNLL
jgi:hypothetical protein